MHIHNFSNQNSLLQNFITELRDIRIQNDRLRFRRNIERIGEILGYELSKTLNYQTNTVTTPLASAQVKSIDDNLVLCSILRAGVTLHNGLLNYFDMADNAFISAYRHHDDTSEGFEILVEYLACPDLNGKTLILADPMLATGQSLVATYKALKPFGTPKQVHLVSVIGAQPGLDFVAQHFKADTHLWIAAVDESLNEKGYIVPGLGDAGDLAFGQKLQH